MLNHLSEVEITFPHQARGRTAYHRISARVSGHTQWTTTLSFLRCSGDAQQALRELMTNPAI